MWAGRTTEKCLQSKVAIVLASSLSAAATIEASTVPRGRSRYACGGAKVNLQGLVGLLNSYCRLGRSATSSHVRLRFKPGLASGARRRMPPISPFA